MILFKKICLIGCLFALFARCDSQNKNQSQTDSSKVATNNMQDFDVKADQFADLQILRYQVPGFDKLSLKEKELVYYLSEAALAGRDIIYDQNYKHNLRIRKTLETIVRNYTGDKKSPDFEKFMVYAKRVWFSNGIHHHYSTKKIQPEFSEAYFTELIKKSAEGNLPLQQGEKPEDLAKNLISIIFDPNVAAKRVNQDANTDMIVNSANNYYEHVSQKEVEDFYMQMRKSGDVQRPIMYGLNSKLEKHDGKLVENVYKIGGKYSKAIEKIVYWLQKAVTVAENDNQKKALQKLIEFYKTGNLKTFDDYNIAWVADTSSTVDAVNGFIEVYGDAIGYKGAYESVVSIKDFEATKRMEAIAKSAQWFEDNSPLLPQHKKKAVSGISYKVITVVMESGDAAPSTPIGINLPNSDWIRKEHGSKSVSLGNITEAYDKAASGGSLDEFTYTPEEKDRAVKHGVLAGNLHTAMHEVIGHASGQLEAGIANPSETLKNYASTLEEARADLVALYYLMDKKLIDIGVMSTLDVGKCEYDGYIRGGLMLQLRRLEEGDDLEEAHMRNRQLVAKWVYEKGMADKVIEKKMKGDKTYFVINDYEKLRTLFGELLKEIQRIKSTGDYAAAKKLVEGYGVKVDKALHKEVKQRYEKLNVAAYSGFIQPKLVPVMKDNKIVDVKIEYPADFVQQMLEYGEKHSFLPYKN